MNSQNDNFRHCKLCGQPAAEPAYRLGEGTVYCCRQCDFHFLNRLDSVQQSAEEPAPLTAIGRTYIDARRDESERLHPKRLELVQSFISKTDINALDVGAGLGQFQLLLTGPGVTATGIEPSTLRRDYAREAFGVELHPQLVEDRYWQDNYREHFDLVTLWDVLEHVDFPRETLASAVSLLKPGGILALETPAREVFSYRLSEWLYRLSSGRISLFLPSFYSAARFGHKQIFTRRQLAGLLKECGLKILLAVDSYTPALLRGSKIILVGRKPPAP